MGDIMSEARAPSNRNGCGRPLRTIWLLRGVLHRMVVTRPGLRDKRQPRDRLRVLKHVWYGIIFYRAIDATGSDSVPAAPAAETR